MNFVSVSNALLVTFGLGLFTWALYRKGGVEEIRENLRWLVVLAVALVVIALGFPALASIAGPYLPAAAAAAASSAWSAWAALRVRDRPNQSRGLSWALWLLSALTALLALAAIFLEFANTA